MGYKRGVRGPNRPIPHGAKRIAVNEEGEFCKNKSGGSRARFCAGLGVIANLPAGSLPVR